MKSQLTSLIFHLRLKTSNLFESVNKQLPYSFVHLLALVIELTLFVRASHHRNKSHASPHVPARLAERASVYARVRMRLWTEWGDDGRVRRDGFDHTLLR